MAGFKFGDIKGKFSKSGGEKPNDENENLGAWDFDDDVNDGFADAYGAEDENGANYDQGYREDDYDRDEGEYQDEDGYQDEEDVSYGEDEYGEAEYDDGYQDEGGQAQYDDEDNPDVLGYNPDVFKSLDDDAPEGENYDEDDYANSRRAQNRQQYAYDDEDEEYAGQGQDYEPSEYDEDAEKQSDGSSDWLIYALLVLLPPVGVWLLWRNNKFDITLRTTLSAASIIWLIILIILLIRWLSPSTDVTTNDPTFLNNPTLQTQSSAPTSSPTAAPSSVAASPTASANTGITAPNNNNNVSQPTEATYVYMANAGIEYHLIEDCGGLVGANKVTLDFAKQRGLNACPNCAGGANIVGGETQQAKVFYATTNGTWYHLDSTCQGMTGATVVTEANAIAAKKTACPKCIGYYGTLGGKAYHSVSNCQDMQNAITKTKAEWEALGKPACAICLKGGTASGTTNATPTQTMVYATANGTYYHTKSNCTGMKDAGYGSLTLAVNSYNKKPCPKCVSADTLYVFATPTGEYFHVKDNCSGMKNAVYNKLSVALALNKPACPKCASMLSQSSSSSALTNNTAVTSKTNTYVYATTNGANFHTDPTCKGMANAKLVTFAQAVSAGKPPCSKCVTADKLMVFATADGVYFHTKSDCTGMKNAVQVKASVAIANNKKACPTCAKVISGTASGTGGGSTGGTTGGVVSSGSQTASGSSTVYIKTGSNASDYYHVGARCTALGLSGMSNVTLEYAIEHSYKACPSCKPPSRIST